MELIGRVWTRIGTWPRAVHIGIALFIGLAAIGAALPDKQSPSETVEAAPATQPEPTTTEYIDTTTTEAPVTTVVTVPPTTTPTVPPTTSKPVVVTTRTTLAARTFAAAAPPPPPPPPPASAGQPSGGQSCSPEYEGACVPAGVSDVDCGGGSGNGPYYVYEKDFRSVGTDPYGLDADNDGIACES